MSEQWIQKLAAEISKETGKSADLHISQLETAYADTKTRFAGQPESVLQLKTKLVVRAMNRRDVIDKSIDVSAILLAPSKAKDIWDYNRRDIPLKVAELKKKLGAEMGQKEAVKAGLIAIDASGKEIPLCPAKRADGSDSKMAGKPIPANPIDSTTQSIYSVVLTKDGSVKPAIITRRGLATQAKPVILGKPVKLRLVPDYKSKDSPVLKFSANHWHCEPIAQPVLQEGIDKLGAGKMLTSLFQQYCTTCDTALSWLVGADPKIPKEYKQMVVLTDGIITQMELSPSPNGNLTITIDSENTPINAQNSAIRCYLPAENRAMIDMGIASKVILAGNMFVGTAQDGVTKELVANLSAIYAYPEFKMPLVDTSDLTMEDIEPEATTQKAWSNVV